MDFVFFMNFSVNFLFGSLPKLSMLRAEHFYMNE